VRRRGKDQWRDTHGAQVVRARAISTAADQTTVKTLVLTRSDFPAGWKPVTDSAAAPDNSFEDLTGITHDYTAKKESTEFEKGDQMVDTSAAIVRPGENLGDDAAMLRSPLFAKNLEAVWRETLKQEIPNGSVESVPHTPLQVTKYGQYSIGHRLVTRFRAEGFGADAYFDVVWLAKGR
jgi:hypothetical protein